MYSSTEKLWKYASSTRGWTNMAPDPKLGDWKDKYVPLTFKDDAKDSDRGTVATVSFGFWESYHDFDVKWNYDKSNNTYTRDNGGAPHKDLDDNSTLTTKNVVVMFVKEVGPVDEHKHLFYDILSTGKALVFQDGKVTEATWTKKDREGRTIIADAKGKKIAFNRGKIIFEILPADNKVTY